MEQAIDAYLSLGTNLGDKISYLQKSLELINKNGCKIIAVSSVYESAPIGFYSEELFLNAAVKISTNHTALELLNLLKKIENQIGRTKVTTNRYESRVIDLDLIFYDTLQIQSEELTVPHQLYHERLFVLLPLLEIDPHLIDPKTGISIQKHANLLIGKQIIDKSAILLIH